MLQYVKRAYRGQNDEKCFLSNPIYGKFDNLPPVKVFVGSGELFLPDCLKFKHLADKEGADVKVYEFAFMRHGFPLMHVPEALEARKQIINIIKEASAEK